MNAVSHKTIREALLKRIQSGEWGLGDLMPGEVDLAEEYGCARTTVNRALRGLAEEGLIERKRKGGTRVRHLPMRQAKFDIPIIREQVEATGSKYRHEILVREERRPPAAISTRLKISPEDKALYLETVHMADDRPFAFEVRWVNTRAVPQIQDANLDILSANEWLVRTVPFSSGDVMFSAESATASVAAAIGVTEGAAVFVTDRTTWLDDSFITTTRVYNLPGYRLYSKL